MDAEDTMDETTELNDVVGWKSTIKFAFPSILTMLCISSYTMVDGAFVSNLIGTNALASINILMPVASILTGLGFMLATGGSAYVANLMGKGELKKARGSFTTIVIFSIGLSLLLTLIALLFMEELVTALGADEVLFDDSMEYGRAYVYFSTFMILQFIFTQMLIVAGRPKISLIVSIAGGVTNIILDYVFIGLLDMGLTGAAIASGCGSLTPSLIGAYLFLNKNTTLHFTRPDPDMTSIPSSCLNGISEMASELTAGITTLLYNIVLMKYVGADGVSAITIIMYVQFFAIAIVIGYSNGVAPLMSYNHGKQDHERMNKLYMASMKFILIMSISIFLAMELGGKYLIAFYANGSEEVMEITTYGAKIFSFAFLAMGINVYASSLFTSLSNGLVSALISITRSLILLAPMILILPYMFGINSIWFAVPITEFVTLALSAYLMIRLGRTYGFLKNTPHPQMQDPMNGRA